MYKLSKLFILLMIAMLGVASCGDEPDGKWQKMKWTNVNNLMNRQGVYLIPEEGGVFVFQCRNYDHPWIDSVTVDGVEYVVNNADNREFIGDWCIVRFDGNNMYVTAVPMPQSLEARSLTVHVTAGDIFDTLMFSQQKGVRI